MFTYDKHLFIPLATKATDIFFHPSPTYRYDTIINGCNVCSLNGKHEKMYAVAKNTWRGFHKIDKDGVGAGSIFMNYFVNNKDFIISSLKSLSNTSQLDTLEDTLCNDIKGRLSNIRQDMLTSYNKLRKPVDLYIEHIVAIAQELDGFRNNLVRLLFLPLDSQMFQTLSLFTESELQRFGIKRTSTYKDVVTRQQYVGLQELISIKADKIALDNSLSFNRIFFDLIWNDRYKKDGSNLFQTNL